MSVSQEEAKTRDQFHLMKEEHFLQTRSCYRTLVNTLIHSDMLETQRSSTLYVIFQKISNLSSQLTSQAIRTIHGRIPHMRNNVCGSNTGTRTNQEVPPMSLEFLIHLSFIVKSKNDWLNYQIVTEKISLGI